MYSSPCTAVAVGKNCWRIISPSCEIIVTGFLPVPLRYFSDDCQLHSMVIMVRGKFPRSNLP
jgi:hypothetical protein